MDKQNPKISGFSTKCLNLMHNFVLIDIFHELCDDILSRTQQVQGWKDLHSFHACVSGVVMSKFVQSTCLLFRIFLGKRVVLGKRKLVA